jgi:hypothetical protein
MIHMIMIHFGFGLLSHSGNVSLFLSRLVLVRPLRAFLFRLVFQSRSSI